MTSDPQTAHVARQLSVRQVFEAVLHRGPISRAELARLTGLSKQTTSEVVRVLEDGGWIRESGRTSGGLGRTATTYEINDAGAYVLGIDLGGTKLHIALANLLGVVVAEAVEPTDRRGGRHVTAQIGAIAARLAAQAGAEPTAIRGAAMGSPGVFDPRSGVITIAPNIPGLDQIDVAAALRDALGVDCVVENDVNLAAKGEQWQGSCVEAQTFAFIALGTGIGMGLVADGRLIRGARGGAGEIAYLPLGGDPFDSRGFRFGTLETAIGSAAILDRYRGFGGVAAETVRDVFDRIALGDEAAIAAIDETARILVQTIMAVKAILDPELVVLGGSIGVRPEIVDRVRLLVERYLPDPPGIAPSALGSRASLIGAVGVALTGLHEQLFGVTGQPGALALPAVEPERRTA